MHALTMHFSMGNAVLQKSTPIKIHYLDVNPLSDCLTETQARTYRVLKWDSNTGC